eukprot:CAMPEP_0172306152 /NCGR_PEP_ID=MMETSP1058-20130122/7282_1 /TAXON_ID=83371 /ORGANISM="Detonula confervacea, Strain CCMP 353" /LENGTH=99 /DNA_ID=CAMNT_0013017947 /DNA_START=56 /DNA_END=355 /DNA_ORIENTATION=+
MPAHAAPSQPQIIATSGAALQTFSSLFPSTSSHHDLDSSEHSMGRSTPRRRPTDSFRQSSCQESYKLFKKCSMSRETEGFSCSDAVARYMRCAMNGDGC